MAKIDPYKWTNGEKPLKSLRKGLTGVYHKDGYKQASNGFVYVQLKEDYPKQYEGKVVYKDGTVINADPPKYQNVLPNLKEYTPYKVDVDELERVRKVQAERSRLDEDYLKHYVVLGKKGKVSDGMAAFDPVFFKRITEFMKAKNTDTILLHNTGSRNRAAVVMSRDGVDMAMIMPSLMGDGVVKKSVLVPITPKQASESRISKANPAGMSKNTNKTKPKTSTMKRTTKKSATKKAAGTIKRASRILAQQKKEYQRIFREKTKKGGDTRFAAQMAGEEYRRKYGATARIRWNRAVKDAKR